MISKKVDGGYILVLQKGELLVKNLTAFASEHKIRSAAISGIGAVSGATVGYWHGPSRRYKFRKLKRFMEIASLTGNLTRLDDKPHLHLHVVLTDSKLRALGGHLQEATIGGTCEIYLHDLKAKLERETDKATGLNLIT